MFFILDTMVTDLAIVFPSHFLAHTEGSSANCLQDLKILQLKGGFRHLVRCHAQCGLHDVYLQNFESHRPAPLRNVMNLIN